MKLKYFADTQTYEAYDKKNNRYHVYKYWEDDEEEALEEIDLEDCDDCSFSLSFNLETGMLTYYLSGYEMYNDGESVERVSFHLNTSARCIAAYMAAKEE